MFIKIFVNSCSKVYEYKAEFYLLIDCLLKYLLLLRGEVVLGIGDGGEGVEVR